ncbi:hypothetical protein [Shinella sp.]|nr:hypothetical protein [Shinella sp.]
MSIELPLRLHRDPDARPVRQAEPIALETIENALARSLRAVREALAACG